MRSRALTGYLLVSVCMILWGVIGILLKRTLHFVDPYSIAWFRFFFSFVFLAAYFLLSSPIKLKILARPPIKGIFAAVFLAGNYLTYSMAIAYAGAIVTQTIIQLGPVFLTLLGVYLLKEKFSKQQWLGLFFSMLGLLLFQSGKTVVVENSGLMKLGILLTILSAISWSLWGVLQKKLLEEHTPQTLNLLTYGAASVLLAPLVSFSTLTNLSLEPVLLLIALGLNTILAYGTLVASFNYLPVNRASVLTTLAPVVTIIVIQILSFAVPNWIAPESLALQEYAGATVMLLGVALVVGAK